MKILLLSITILFFGQVATALGQQSLKNLQLQHSDRGYPNQDSAFLRLAGNVNFTFGGYELICDSAVVEYKNKSLKDGNSTFANLYNVKMAYPNKIVVTSNYMRFDVINEIAMLKGKIIVNKNGLVTNNLNEAKFNFANGTIN